MMRLVGLFRAWPAAFLLALSIGIATGASAQSGIQPSAPPAGVWTVDPDRLYAETLLGQRIRANLEARAAELSRENRRIEAELIAEERELTERRATLSVEAFRQLADAFDAKVSRIREEQDAKTRDIQRLQETGPQSFLGQVVPLLSDMMRERDSAVLLDRRAVFLSFEISDITDEAIARINEELGDGQTPRDGE